MDVDKIFTVCNTKLYVVNYLKHRTVYESCYKKFRRKNNNVSHHNQKSKVLITISKTIRPQTSHEILEFQKILEPRLLRSTRT